MKFYLSAVTTLILGFAGFAAFAGITQGKIKIEIKSSEVAATPLKGFHVNDKAPASAIFDDAKMKTPPKTKTEQSLTFEVPAGAIKAQLKFFVCDDAKTVCEQHTHEVDLKTKKSKATTATTDDSKTYLAVAQTLNLKSTKPTLMVFSAPWCPACIRLKSETLNKTEVKNTLKKINSVFLNVDLVEHEAISKKFNVKAIPTMILLTPAGQEITRWLDFQLVNSFGPELAAALKISADVEQTKKMAETGDQAAIRRSANNAYNQMNYLEALRWFTLSTNPGDLQKKLYSEIQVAQEAKDADKTKADDYLKVLSKATTLSTSKLDSLTWTIQYFEEVSGGGEKAIDENNKAKILATIRGLNSLVENPKTLEAELKTSTMTGLYSFEAMEILDYMARGYELVKDEAAKKQTQERIFKLANAKKIDLNQPGIAIHVIYYMSQAGHRAEAEALTKKLITKYPKTYVYYDRYAKMLLKDKRYEEALVQVDTALKFKEGNEPQLNLVKVKILAGQKKKDEAISLVDQTLVLIEPFPEKYKRTKTSLASIKEDLTKSEQEKK